jgi:putative membrane protein
MTSDSRKPKAFVLEAEPAPEVKPKRKSRSPDGVTFETEESQGELAVLAPALPPPRRLRWGMLFVGSLASLVTLGAGLAVTQLIEGFFARSQPLGWFALAVAGIAVVSALAIIIREIWGLARLSRIGHIQATAAHALNFNDEPAALKAIDGLMTLHRGRHDALWGLENIRQHRDDVMDARDRLRLVERYLVDPRDNDAHRVIARSARRVTLITTVTPTAALDMLVVAFQNLRMIREIASLYGGRPSALATFRLARLVLGHLAVTGGLALSDNLLQHVVGKGLLGRLSARFGEGAVNGIMTARIGIAARDVCRPIPQEPQAKETLGSLVRELVSLDDSGPPP